MEDFALLHPAGTLGRRLLKVADLMHTGEEIPLVRIDATMKDAILEMTAKRLGITGVVDDSRRLVGIITDGDLRRALEVKGDIMDSAISDVMTKRPKVIDKDLLAEAAVKKMEEHSITALFITDASPLDSSVQERKNGDEVIGIIHLHDLLKAGVV
jgi:arabinose-5-phosphate isomerase